MAGRLSISENHAPAAMRWTPSAFFRAAAAAAGRTVRGAKRSSAEADGAGPAPAATAAPEPFPSIVELADDDNSDPFFALILVNQPLVAGFRHLWQRASVRVCADGGANRLYDGLSAEDRGRLLPSFIKGDLDSIREDVAQYYRERGVPIIMDQNQDTTDLMKCMEELEAWERRTNAATHPVLICGALSGRFDHMMHTVHFLHQHTQSHRQIFLISDENIACLLDRGQHHIAVDPNYEGPTCGLMPCAGPAVISTRGLQWNLATADRAMCSFGGLISTSNALADLEVVVETDAPVVWTVERNPAALFA